MPRCICRKRWQEEVQAEALVAQHLRAFCQFWHTRSGLEVDFIVYGPNLFLAIEVKSSCNCSHEGSFSCQSAGDCHH